MIDTPQQPTRQTWFIHDPTGTAPVTVLIKHGIVYLKDGAGHRPEELTEQDRITEPFPAGLAERIEQAKQFHERELKQDKEN